MTETAPVDSSGEDQDAPQPAGAGNKPDPPITRMGLSGNILVGWRSDGR